MEITEFLEDQLGFIFKIFGESMLTVPAMLQPTSLDPKSRHSCHFDLVKVVESYSNIFSFLSLKLPTCSTGVLHV